MAAPLHEFRIGLIRASIRTKRTRSGIRHTITVVRLFRNGDVWKESTRFGRDDLPVLRLVLDRAYGWLLSHGTLQDEIPDSGKRARSRTVARTSYRRPDSNL